MTSLSTNVAWLMRHRHAAISAEQLAAVPQFTAFEGFGDNPGRLGAQVVLPPGLPAGAPLVVLLHGCGQSAAGFAEGAGWPELAARHGFALLLPEQRGANNPNLCFTWFDPRQVARGLGEMESIRQMIDHLVAGARLDSSRVHVCGLSAGGAMAASLLACHPELFAAGAIIAGLPHGAATSVHEALAAMTGSLSRPAGRWGDLVRSASAHAGPWPRIAVWQGVRDNVVAPVNASALLAQWTEVHGLDTSPPEETRQDGIHHLLWRDADGRAAVEGFSLEALGHGVPILLGEGVPGPFALPAALSAARTMLGAWGLADDGAGRTLEAHPPAPQVGH
jgi:poly(hydroxyalkanoate) depolymerase family esterase